MNTTNLAALTTAAHIETLRTALTNVSSWSDADPRKAGLMAMYREEIAELEREEMADAVELGAEVAVAEVETACEQAEASAALVKAVETARAAGSVEVAGVDRLARELERMAPGCGQRRAGARIWTLVVEMESGEVGELRLSAQDGRYWGRMSWRVVGPQNLAA